MGRRKPRKDCINNINVNRTAMKKVSSSTSSSAKCGTGSIDCDFRECSWEMSQGTCTCDENIRLLTLLKDPKRGDESSGIGTDPPASPAHGNHHRRRHHLQGRDAVQDSVNPLPSSLHLFPSPHHGTSATAATISAVASSSTVQDFLRCVESHSEPPKGPSRRGYNLRPRKCTCDCMGQQDQRYGSEKNMAAEDSAQSAVVMEHGAIRRHQEGED
ncbi:uncharacterized protein LOC143284930 isoform X2 [Babylonia areolata]|uniref:uncharacterized protein LOC143284930 isoform X2 n=1 Tax=Babylonia areolata TaxID=304850 RepID=UPI003FD4AF78